VLISTAASTSVRTASGSGLDLQAQATNPPGASQHQRLGQVRGRPARRSASALVTSPATRAASAAAVRRAARRPGSAVSCAARSRNACSFSHPRDRGHRSADSSSSVPPPRPGSPLPREVPRPPVRIGTWIGHRRQGGVHPPPLARRRPPVGRRPHQRVRERHSRGRDNIRRTAGSSATSGSTPAPPPRATLSRLTQLLGLRARTSNVWAPLAALAPGSGTAIPGASPSRSGCSPYRVRHAAPRCQLVAQLDQCEAGGRRPPPGRGEMSTRPPGFPPPSQRSFPGLRRQRSDAQLREPGSAPPRASSPDRSAKTIPTGPPATGGPRR